MVGQTTGLWHPCVPKGAGAGYERWSFPLLLIVAVPVVLGIRAIRDAGPAAKRPRFVLPSVLLALIALALVAIPSGSCIS